MQWRWIGTALLLTLSANLNVAKLTDGVLRGGTYSNESLGLRYVPPNGMHDTTTAARASIRERAAASHRTSAFSLLLAMSSGPDDTARHWHSLGVEAFPRSEWADLDDYDAESLMNASVARGGLAVGQNAVLTFSRQKFVGTQFKFREGHLTKHATVYTTVRRGWLVSFAFSGNSEEQVNKEAETMKSLSVSGPD